MQDIQSSTKLIGIYGKIISIWYGYARGKLVEA